jgi:glycosyltransferase involved in cell wall biosynthesis
MNVFKSLTIIIPCFNEEPYVSKIFETCNYLAVEFGMNFLIIDNGSQDGTFKKMNFYFNDSTEGIKIYKIKENKGYGNAIVTGIKMCDTFYVGWTHADQISNLYNLAFVLNSNLSQITEPDKFAFKAKRAKYPIYDKIFTVLMSIYVRKYIGKFFLDINAQPSIFPKKFLLTNISELESVDLVDLIVTKMAVLQKLQIVRVKFKNNLRIHGKGSNRTLGQKIKYSKKIHDLINHAQ